MGRPPIGKTAMSNAERQRRFRAKHAPVTEHVTERTATPYAECAAFRGTIVRLYGEIVNLNKTRKAEWRYRERLEREIARLEAEIAALRGAPKPHTPSPKREPAVRATAQRRRDQQERRAR